MAQQPGAHLGHWIRASRKSVRWTQAALGQLLGVSQAKISLWERGSSTPSEEEREWLDSVFSEEAERLGIALPDGAQQPARPPASAAVESSQRGEKTKQRSFMVTEFKSQIDRIWDTMWSGGISNPLSVIEQLTYLLFIKRLDELHTLTPEALFGGRENVIEGIFEKLKAVHAQLNAEVG